jgi:rSAM/selenodomain-associated transferase 1
MQRALIVFAKVPGVDQVKTRIAATEGKSVAESVYAELIEISASLMARFRPHVFFAGSTVPGLLYERYTTANSFTAQSGETLGERMANAAAALFKQAYAGVVIVGCDCPELVAEDIDEAFAHMEKGADVVFGPAVDGGYYLIGLRQGREEIFGIDQWGTPEVLDKSIALAKERGWKHALITKRSDVDTMDDYRSWKKRLGGV